MRIRDLVRDLSMARALLSDFSIEPTDGGQYALSSVDQLRIAFDILSRHPETVEYARYARGLNLLDAPGSPGVTKFSYSQDQAHAIRHFVSQVVEALRLLERVWARANPPALPGDSLSIKLPPISSLEELVAIARSLQHVFDLPLMRLSSETTTVAGFDLGSVWIELLVATPIAIGIVKKLLHVYIEFARARMEIEYGVQLIRSKRISNDHLQALQANTAKQLDALAESYADEVLEQAQKPTETAERNETRLLIANSIRELDQLLHRGLEIHPSLGTGPKSEAPLKEPLTLQSVEPKKLPPHVGPPDKKTVDEK